MGHVKFRGSSSTIDWKWQDESRRGHVQMMTFMLTQCGSGMDTSRKSTDQDTSSNYRCAGRIQAVFGFEK